MTQRQHFTSLALGTLLALNLHCQTAPAPSTPEPSMTKEILTAHLWNHRVILILGGQETDHTRQATLWNESPKACAQRDLVIYQCPTKESGHKIVPQPSGQLTQTPLSKIECQSLHAQFVQKEASKEALFVLIGKDGGVKLRARHPVSKKELFGLIDSMPMRQREMRGQQEE